MVALFFYFFLPTTVLFFFPWRGLLGSGATGVGPAWLGWLRYKPLCSAAAVDPVHRRYLNISPEMSRRRRPPSVIGSDTVVRRSLVSFPRLGRLVRFGAWNFFFLSHRQSSGEGGGKRTRSRFNKARNFCCSRSTLMLLTFLGIGRLVLSLRFLDTWSMGNGLESLFFSLKQLYFLLLKGNLELAVGWWQNCFTVSGLMKGNEWGEKLPEWESLLLARLCRPLVSAQRWTGEALLRLWFRLMRLLLLRLLWLLA